MVEYNYEECKKPHGLSDEAQENHETNDLPDRASGASKVEEVDDDVVPKPLADEGNDGDGDEEGQHGRDELHVEFPPLAVRPGQIRKSIDDSVAGLLEHCSGRALEKTHKSPQKEKQIG